ncbi:MAG: Gfo/Idh/MocA family oxidoreductase [Gemmatimonadota bacterium]|nr:Gfo/Idh/MocA family oxidoreductase [Gemmatimonadota bacterium]
MSEKIINRRRFIRKTAAASLALGLSTGAPGFSAQQGVKPVRLGFVGVGNRGTGLLRKVLRIEGVEVPAVCDINEKHLTRAIKAAAEMGHNKPEGYSRGPEDYRRLCDRRDLDGVLTATPWELHTPVMLAAMEAGKYGATEVPAAVTLDQCWQLVETSERTGAPCMLLENGCYDSKVMMIMNMIQQGLFGEMLHCEVGYQHDVRYLGGKEGKIGPGGELLWRGKHAVDRNGSLYPTHQMGPAAWWLDINRSDRLTYLVSMSTKSLGMNCKIAQMFGAGHPNAKRTYANGDINTTLIRTEKGATVTLYHDTQTPRPHYDTGRIQGTKGIYMSALDSRMPDYIYIEGLSPKEHSWEDTAPYFEQYGHALWKKHGEAAREAGGHGGIDYLTLQQFILAVRQGVQTPIDVYDAATWSAMAPLSEQSVAGRSRVVDVPDFTRGRWKEKRQVEVLGV